MPTAAGSYRTSNNMLAYHQFSLTVDAIKNIPIVGPTGDGTKYVLNWFFDESNQGATQEVAPSKDEAVFNMQASFIAEHSGLLNRLLQLNVVSVREKTGERELAGVLMIDLNAHVPKPPSKNSRQRATLHMSRCPGPKPLLIRLTIQCVPCSASMALQQKRTATGSLAPPVGGGGSNNNKVSAEQTKQPTVTVSASTSPVNVSTTTTGQSPIPIPPPGAVPLSPEEAAAAKKAEELDEARLNAQVQDQLNRLRATVATLSSANEQLRDENIMMRQAVEKARREPDYTFEGGGNGNRPSVSPIPRESSTSRVEASAVAFEQEEKMADLLTELKTQQAEMAILQKGLQSARDTIRQLSQREEGFQREISSLVRTNKALEDENLKLKDKENSVNQRYETALGIANSSGDATKTETELLAARDMLSATQQMNRDLKAMLDQATKAQTDLKEEVNQAKQGQYDAENKFHKMVQQYQQREQDATLRADKSEHACRTVEKHSKQLHEYCTMANERAKQLLSALESERSISEKRRKKILDLKALLKAHQIAGAIE